VAGSRSNDGSKGDSPAGRLAREVASLQASLLGKLDDELDGEDPRRFADAARRLAVDFGAVTATAVDAASGPASSSTPKGRASSDARPADLSAAPEPALALPLASAPESAPAEPEPGPEPAPAEPERDEYQELLSLYQPGHMRRRLDQMAETNRRYGHPFALAVFDASGPGARNGDAGAGQETALALVAAALRDSIRIVDEAFHLEEDAICVLAPNLRTVEAVQMAERLLGRLEALEKAGGLRIVVSAGVVACPDHGADVEKLLHKADAAMWRARAVGQPVGVGDLQDR
jgi:diguanylate cyclase (GGDEF)-like protein